MWNEVTLWLTQMMDDNEYIPLLYIRKINDAEEIYSLQFLMSLIRPSFSSNSSMHKIDTHPVSRITNLFVLTYFEVKYLPQHIRYKNNIVEGKVQDNNATPDN